MFHLLILADDFTGVLDTGVRLAARGIPTQVLTAKAHRFTKEGAEVLVIDAEIGHLSPKETDKVVRALTENAIHAGISCAYRRIDPAFRGSVGAELEAALSGNGESVLPSLPTFPELGRTTVGGRRYIDGVPVNEDPFGKDPFEPIRTTEVAALLRPQSSLPAESFPSPETDGTMPSRRGILIFDVGSEKELFVSGRALFRDTVPRVPAGCAESAAYLSKLLGLGVRGDSNLPEPSPRLLVLCGSVSPITRRQLSVVTDKDFRHMYLTPQEKVLPDFFATAVGNVALQTLREQLGKHPHSIIGSNDASDSTEAKNCAGSLGLPPDKLHLRVTNALGTVFVKLIEGPVLDTLLLTGGDTLLRCMGAPGTQKVEPVGELENGIVLYRFSYCGKGRVTITESGGLGEEDSLPRPVRLLEKKTEGGKR